MKIGLFTDTFYPEVNGVATSCLNLARALEKRGHEVHVYAPKCKDWECNDLPNYHYLMSAPLLVLKDRNFAIPGTGTLSQALNMHFDVVHTHSEFVMGTLGRYIAHVSGSARVHTYHTVWEDYTYYLTHGHADETVKKITRKYSEWWCEHFDRVIVPTGKTRRLLQRYGVSSAIDIIPSGMDLERFDPKCHSAEEIARTRQECGVKEGERVLLYIGRLAKEKNMDQLIRVFPKVHEVYPDVRFVIIGEGPLRSSIEKQVAELGVEDCVSVVGSKPWEQIDRYYAIGEVFASASHSETQGLTYIEAMASGLCVCAVKDPCLYGVIEDGVSGVLTGDSDEELLEGLLLAFSPLGEDIRSNAVEAAAPFSTEAFAEQVEKCYLAALEAKHAEKQTEPLLEEV